MLEPMGLDERASIKATRDRSDIKSRFQTLKLSNKYLKLCMLHRIGSAILPTINSQSGIDQDLTAPLAPRSPLFYCAVALNRALL